MHAIKPNALPVTIDRRAVHEAFTISVTLPLTPAAHDRPNCEAQTQGEVGGGDELGVLDIVPGLDRGQRARQSRQGGYGEERAARDDLEQLVVNHRAGGKEQLRKDDVLQQLPYATAP